MSRALPPSPSLALDGTGAAAHTLRLAEALLANRAVGWLRALCDPLVEQPAAQALQRLIQQCLDAAAKAGLTEAGGVAGRAGGGARRGEGAAPWPDPAAQQRAPVSPWLADRPSQWPAMPGSAALASGHAALWSAPATGLAAVRHGIAVSANEAKTPDAAHLSAPRPWHAAVRSVPPPLTPTLTPAAVAAVSAPPVYSASAPATHSGGAAVAAGFALRRQGQPTGGRLAAGHPYPMPGIYSPPLLAGVGAAAGFGPGFGAATPAAAAHKQPPSQASLRQRQGAQPADSPSMADPASPITPIKAPHQPQPQPQPTRLVTDMAGLQGLLQAVVADSRQRHALPALSALSALPAFSALPTLKAEAESAANPRTQLVASRAGSGPAPASAAATPGTTCPALDALTEDILVDRLADRLQDRLRELALRHLGFTGGVL